VAADSAAAVAGVTDMTQKDTLASALATATCALLGTGGPAPVEAQEVPNWTFDTALLYYGENDDRVRDVSLNVLAKRDFDDERFLDLSFTADTLTGASPSGAVALGGPQTFTSPSGDAVYSTPAGEVPLDDTFLDTRFALGVGWTQPLGRLYKGSAGISFSTEYDYTHVGANLALSRDFNLRNTTLSAGLAWSQDDLDPVGGAPLPLTQMLDVGDLSNRTGSQTKDIIDVLFGVTQVLGRTTVLRLNYSYSDSSGYLNDPYKFLSVVDPITGNTVLRMPPPGNAGPGGVYRFEGRPDTRTKQALYAEAKKYLGGQVLTGSYRYMTDDWDINSHTLDVRMRWPLGAAMYVEPHLRYYSQSAADFYRLALVNGEPLPQFASADYRLADFDATTVGMKLGRELSHDREWSVRLEYYQQSANVPAAMLIGNQANREQSADLGAIIAQFTYRFGI
jgi:hypothetical protein